MGVVLLLPPGAPGNRGQPVGPGDVEQAQAVEQIVSALVRGHPGPDGLGGAPALQLGVVGCGGEGLVARTAKGLTALLTHDALEEAQRITGRDHGEHRPNRGPGVRAAPAAAQDRKRALAASGDTFWACPEGHARQCRTGQAVLAQPSTSGGVAMLTDLRCRSRASAQAERRPGRSFTGSVSSPSRREKEPAGVCGAHSACMPRLTVGAAAASAVGELPRRQHDVAVGVATGRQPGLRRREVPEQGRLEAARLLEGAQQERVTQSAAPGEGPALERRSDEWLDHVAGHVVVPVDRHDLEAVGLVVQEVAASAAAEALSHPVVEDDGQSDHLGHVLLLIR